MNIFETVKEMFGGAKSAKRFFEIYKVHNKKYKNKTGGRYRNNTPKEAAKKAFTRILRKDKSKMISFDIEVRDITRDSLHKIYRYTFTRIKRECPITFEKNDVKITIYYRVYSKYVAEKMKGCKDQKKKKKSKRYICSKKEKNDKKIGLCCLKGNAVDKRSYELCKKHIRRIRKD